MDPERIAIGGGFSAPYLGRILLDPASETGGGADAAAEPAATPSLDLSGISAADLAAVPDLRGEEAEATAAAPAATPDQPTAPAATTPADPNVAAGAAQQPVVHPQQAQAQTIRDVAAMYGLDMGRFKDDGAAFAHIVSLARQAGQANYYAQLGQQLAPHYEGIQQYLATQQRPAQPEERPAWQPPEFDERWLNFVERDEQTGAFKPRAGAFVDPAIVGKVQAYADWMANYNRNPMAVITPAIETRARAIAEEIVGRQFEARQQQQTVGQIVESNAAWLYQADAQGNRLIDPVTNQYVPTPTGARYLHHVRTLGQAGIRDPRILDQTAQQLVRAELAANPASAAAQPAGGPSPAQARAAVAQPPVNPGQAIDPARRPSVPGATEPSGQGLSLTEMLRRSFSEGGVTDNDFAHLGQ
jgi:hypothetical protein